MLQVESEKFDKILLLKMARKVLRLCSTGLCLSSVAILSCML